MVEQGCVAWQDGGARLRSGQSGGARLYRSHLTMLLTLIGTTFSCRGIVALGGDILL